MHTLVRGLKSGKTESWAEFVDRYSPLIMRYCQRRSLKVEDAEEVLQESLYRISRAMPGFDYDPAIGRFGGWVGQIVRRELGRYVERVLGRNIGGNGFDPDQVLSGNTDAAWKDEFYAWLTEQALDDVRARVSEKQWHYFYECWINDEKPGVVAARLGVKPDLVYKARFQVNKVLKEVVDDLMNEEFIE